MELFYYFVELEEEFWNKYCDLADDGQATALDLWGRLAAEERLRTQQHRMSCSSVAKWQVNQWPCPFRPGHRSVSKLHTTADVAPPSVEDEERNRSKEKGEAKKSRTSQT
jgi:hypothetical protein